MTSAIQRCMHFCLHYGLHIHSAIAAMTLRQPYPLVARHFGKMQKHLQSALCSFHTQKTCDNNSITTY